MPALNFKCPIVNKTGKHGGTIRACEKCGSEGNQIDNGVCGDRSALPTHNIGNRPRRR